jgi:hypothetical protein
VLGQWGVGSASIKVLEWELSESVGERLDAHTQALRESVGPVGVDSGAVMMADNGASAGGRLGSRVRSRTTLRQAQVLLQLGADVGS